MPASLTKNSLRAERKARPGDCLYAPLAQLVEQLTLNQWVLGSSPRWCTTNSLTVSVGLFFCCLFRKGHDLVHHRGREQPAPRVSRTAGQKRPGGAFLGRGRVPNRVHQGTALRKSKAVFLLCALLKSSAGCTIGDEIAPAGQIK